MYDLHGHFEVGEDKVSVDWEISIEWGKLFHMVGPMLFVSTDESEILMGLVWRR